MKTKMYDLAIIGAGASGLTCAIAAAQKCGKLKIILLENKDRVGKKILATGNGKCNLSNTDKSVEGNYNSSDIASVKEALDIYNSEDNVDFFSKLGLVCRIDGEGRIYPYSQHSSSVLDSLRNECDRLNIEAKCSVTINSVKKEQGKFKILTDETTVVCESLVIASGGMSYVNSNKLSGYDILRDFGHDLTELYPSLVALKVKNPIKSLKGLRVPATATLYVNNLETQSEIGEIQFTEQGISGIAVMQLSQRISRGIAQKKKESYTVSLDLMPSYTMEEITKIIKEKITLNSEAPTTELLCGIFHKMLARAIIIDALKKDFPENVDSLSENNIRAIVKSIKKFDFSIADTMGFANAQVTGGGARLNQFNCKTMESNLTVGLYAAGEVLDVVGACGGFNLNWAWSSGRIAGESAAVRSNKNA